MNRNRAPVQAGFGLVELMIAMVLGLLVLGAAIAVFQSNQRTFNANSGQNRIQENARVAYELVSTDIRSAGSSACSSEAMVLGQDGNSQAFRAPLTGSATEFTVVSADDLSYRVALGTASTTSVTLVESAPNAAAIFRVGDAVMVCNAAMTGFTTVSAVNGQRVDFAAALAFNPANTANAAEGSISIARFRNNRWFVAANGRDSGNSLYVSRFGGARQEVSDGVQALNVAFHQAAGGNPNAYVAAPTNFQVVNAVRIGMPMRAIMPGRNPGESQTITRNVDTTASIRNRNL